MNCQLCNQNPATVHIIDIPAQDSPASEPQRTERHVCEACACGMKLPQLQLSKKGSIQFLKLLQEQVRRAREEGSVRCPQCGMTLAEFRSKGRLGCPNDYELFGAQIQPLLQRVHNATRHKGRIPGLQDEELERLQALSNLRAQLEEAVREEAYENAARLRDEIQEIEGIGSRPDSGA